MTSQFVISDYIEAALARAEYDKFDDGSYAGRIPACEGVLSFAPSLRECETELRGVLEDWLLVGFKLRHPLPIIDGIDFQT